MELSLYLEATILSLNSTNNELRHFKFKTSKECCRLNIYFSLICICETFSFAVTSRYSVYSSSSAGSRHALSRVSSGHVSPDGGQYGSVLLDIVSGTAHWSPEAPRRAITPDRQNIAIFMGRHCKQTFTIWMSVTRTNDHRCTQTNQLIVYLLS